jgi:UPF0716 family protein affecting phage T7 exclusion
MKVQFQGMHESSSATLILKSAFAFSVVALAIFAVVSSELGWGVTIGEQGLTALAGGIVGTLLALRH